MRANIFFPAMKVSYDQYLRYSKKWILPITNFNNKLQITNIQKIKGFIKLEKISEVYTVLS